MKDTLRSCHLMVYDEVPKTQTLQRFSVRTHTKCCHRYTLLGKLYTTLYRNLRTNVRTKRNLRYMVPKRMFYILYEFFQ